MNLVSKITAGLVLSVGLLTANEYNVDKVHSNVGFSVKHMMVTNVYGKFTSYDSIVDFDESTKTFKKLSANIDTKSIDTGITDRDNHLKSNDFFGVEEFPKMTFEMTSYKADGDEGKIKGNLTIRGITKPVTLKVEDISVLGPKMGFSLEGKINRSDFGLKWNKAIELGGVAVADEVKIKVDIEAAKK